MFRDFFRALGQLTDPRILGVVGRCILLSIAVLVGLFFLMFWLLKTPWFEISWLEAAADWAVIAVAVVLAIFLFPLLVSAFLGLFLERIAHVVEQRYYPELPAAPGLPFWSGLGASLRFLVVVVAANALLLFLLLVPPVYVVAYLLVNGYLVSREYFELVAFRRSSTTRARALRGRHGVQLLLLGIGIAALFMLPIVNFFAPILATATMVHRFQAWHAVDR